MTITAAGAGDVAMRPTRDEYHRACDTPMPAVPYSFVFDSTQRITFFLRRRAPSGLRDAVYDQYGCRACANRIDEYASLVGPLGPPLFDAEFLARTEGFETRAVYERLHELAQQPVNVVTPEVVFATNAEPFGHAQVVGTFTHWYMRVPEQLVMTHTPATQRIADACHKYLPELLPAMIARMYPATARSADGMIASLRLLETILHEVAYGATFLRSLRWLLRVLEWISTYDKPWSEMSSSARQVVCLMALCWSDLGATPDGGVCFSYHQSNGNLLGLLEDARDEAAMRRLCAERLSPQNYQRPTAAPSLGQVNVAEKALGDFHVSLMTHAELAVLGPIAVPCGAATRPTSTSAGAFSAMRDSAAAAAAPIDAPSTPGSFASRCGVDGKAARIRSEVKTLTALIAYMRANPAAELQISTRTGCFVQMCSNSRASEILRYPFTWGVHPRRRSLDEYGLRDKFPVAYVVPTWEMSRTHRSVFFIAADAPVARGLVDSVCCFPEFLNTEHSRTCGTVFEQLNKTMKLQIPPTGPYALGLAFSVQDEAGSIGTTAYVRLEGVDLEIRRL